MHLSQNPLDELIKSVNHELTMLALLYWLSRSQLTIRKNLS